MSRRQASKRVSACGCRAAKAPRLLSAIIRTDTICVHPPDLSNTNLRRFFGLRWAYPRCREILAETLEGMVFPSESAALKEIFFAGGVFARRSDARSGNADRVAAGKRLWWRVAGGRWSG